MADALNSEQTESKPLNTELETPTLDAATEHEQPSTEPTYNHQSAEYHHGEAGQTSASESHDAVATAEPADEDMSMEDFAAALESFDREQAAEAAIAQGDENNIIQGTVVKLTDKHVVVDVGLKSEGLIPLEQVTDHTGQSKLHPGDVIDVVVEREEAEGGYLLSYEKAQQGAPLGHV